MQARLHHRSLTITILAAFLCFALASTASAAGKVKVFILAGQSNMEGKAKVSLLAYQIKQPETRELFAHLESGGEWVVRDDVWIKFLARKGI